MQPANWKFTIRVYYSYHRDWFRRFKISNPFIHAFIYLLHTHAHRHHTHPSISCSWTCACLPPSWAWAVLVHASGMGAWIWCSWTYAWTLYSWPCSLMTCRHHPVHPRWVAPRKESVLQVCPSLGLTSTAALASWLVCRLRRSNPNTWY